MDDVAEAAVAEVSEKPEDKYAKYDLFDCMKNITELDAEIEKLSQSANKQVMALESEKQGLMAKMYEIIRAGK